MLKTPRGSNCFDSQPKIVQKKVKNYCYEYQQYECVTFQMECLTLHILEFLQKFRSWHFVHMVAKGDVIYCS